MQVKVKPAIFGLGAHAHKASPEVNGLEKPPAGSRREGGSGPRGKEAADGAGPAPFTGTVH